MTFQTRHMILLATIAMLAFDSVALGDVLKEGRAAFMNYDFGLAGEKYEKFAQSIKKAKNPTDDGLLDKYVHQLEIAENSLDNVQKIEIIARLDVPAEDFFKSIKLPSTGGKMVDPDVALLKKRQNASDFAYSSESGDLMMWSEIGEDGMEHIMQSERLLDGTWEKPVKVGEILNDGGNARNPFLLTDGVTLYFSGDGEGSMGGYDLFVATRDPGTGVFRQPVAVGFPFNSPFNEYMMAIDDENGIGWWVTDRNQLDNLVSVYVFKTNDVRKNYVVDEEQDIISLARLDDISVAQDPSVDYGQILQDIDARSRQSKGESASDFIFPMPEGRVARSLSDFSSPSAKRNMQQYLQASEEQESELKKLSELRKKYHKTDKKKGNATALKNQILELEAKVAHQSDLLKKMRNTIITAELKH